MLCPPSRNVRHFFEKIVIICPSSRNVRHLKKKSSRFVRHLLMSATFSEKSSRYVRLFKSSVYSPKSYYRMSDAFKFWGNCISCLDMHVAKNVSCFFFRKMYGLMSANNVEHTTLSFYFKISC